MHGCKMMRIRLAEIPKFAKEDYHPDQVAFYSKLTELTFKALNLPSVLEFMERFAANVNLEVAEVRVSRMPAARSRVSLAEKEGKPHLVMETLKGRTQREGGFIDIYPDLFWPRRMAKPVALIGIRGFILNNSIRALIHEMLHRSGIRNETETRRLTDQYHKDFRRTHLSRFDKEFKPLLKEWKKFGDDFVRQGFSMKPRKEIRPYLLPGSRDLFCSNCETKTVIILSDKGKGRFCPKCDRELIEDYKREKARIESVKIKRPRNFPRDTAGYKEREQSIWGFQRCTTCGNLSDDSFCLVKRKTIKNPEMERTCRDHRRRGL